MLYDRLWVIIALLLLCSCQQRRDDGGSASMLGGGEPPFEDCRWISAEMDHGRTNQWVCFRKEFEVLAVGERTAGRLRRWAEAWAESPGYVLRLGRDRPLPEQGEEHDSRTGMVLGARRFLPQEQWPVRTDSRYSRQEDAGGIGLDLEGRPAPLVQRYGRPQAQLPPARKQRTLRCPAGTAGMDAPGI